MERRKEGGGKRAESVVGRACKPAFPTLTQRSPCPRSTITSRIINSAHLYFRTLQADGLRFTFSFVSAFELQLAQQRRYETLWYTRKNPCDAKQSG